MNASLESDQTRVFHECVWLDWWNILVPLIGWHDQGTVIDDLLTLVVSCVHQAKLQCFGDVATMHTFSFHQLRTAESITGRIQTAIVAGKGQISGDHFDLLVLWRSLRNREHVLQFTLLPWPRSSVGNLWLLEICCRKWLLDRFFRRSMNAPQGGQTWSWGQGYRHLWQARCKPLWKWGFCPILEPYRTGWSYVWIGECCWGGSRRSIASVSPHLQVFYSRSQKISWIHVVRPAYQSSSIVVTTSPPLLPSALDLLMKNIFLSLGRSHSRWTQRTALVNQLQIFLHLAKVLQHFGEISTWASFVIIFAIW